MSPDYTVAMTLTGHIRIRLGRWRRLLLQAYQDITFGYPYGQLHQNRKPNVSAFVLVCQTFFLPLPCIGRSSVTPPDAPPNRITPAPQFWKDRSPRLI